MKYLILTDHRKNDLRVSKSQRYLNSVTLQIPSFIAKFFWVPGYSFMVYLLTYFYKFDRIYAHDLFLSYAAVKRNKPVYADLHENFYDSFHHAKFRFKFVAWFFRDERIEKMIETVMDKAIIITTSAGNAAWYDTDLYYPNVGEPVERTKKEYASPFRLVFIGRNRGLEDINWHGITATELFIMSDNFPDIEIPSFVAKTIRRIDHLANQWILDHSLYGLQPNTKSEQSRTCSPNKLFTYMSNGLATICADHMEEVVRVIDKYDCGYHAPTIEEAILKAFNDPDVLTKCNNAYEAVRREYNEETLVKPIFERL